jgi:hypothetical protein
MAKQSATTFVGGVGFSGTTNAGLTLNSLTTTQRDALTALNGTLIYNTTTHTVQKYENGTWFDVNSGGGAIDHQTLTPSSAVTALTINQNFSARGVDLIKTVTDAAQSTEAVRIQRIAVVDDGNTYAMSNGALSVSSSVTQTSGAITDSGIVATLSQNNTAATGDVLRVSNSGTGSTLNVKNATASVLTVGVDGNTTITPASAVTGFTLTQNFSARALDMTKTVTNAAQSTEVGRIQRSAVVNDGGTYILSNPAFSVSSSITQTSGVITDTSIVGSFSQNNSSASGDVLRIVGAGTGLLLSLRNASSVLASFNSAGKLFIGGTTSATALIHLAAGSATANTAPLKLTAGVNLTTPEAGVVEFDGSHFYGTIGSTRYQLDQQAAAGAAGGDLTGTYPNPTIKSSVSLAGSPTTTTQSPNDNSTKIATTAYVDSAIAGLDAKDPVAFGQTSALPANTYANGSSGVGATLTANSNGFIILDGVTLTSSYNGLRVLVMGESTSSNNGWYVITDVGSLVTKYVLTRAIDSDQAAEIESGYITAVNAPSGLTAGSANNGKAFVSSAPSPFIVGTSAITFSLVGAAYSAGTGLTLTNTTFAIDSTVATLSGSQALTNKNLTGSGNTFPTFNQNTTGTAAGLSSTLAVTSGGTGVGTAFTAGSIVFAGSSGVYSQNNTGLFWDNSNLRLGVGTVTPGASISSTLASPGIEIAGLNGSGTDLLLRNAGTGMARSYLASSRGTLSSPTASVVGDSIASISFGGHDGTNYTSAAAIAVSVDSTGTVSTGFVPGNIQFKTGSNSSAPLTALTIDRNQNVTLANALPVTSGGTGNTSGTVATLTTARSIYGNNFDGSAALNQIIASTYGGTGNGFTKFTGPTTAEKTFTLPDSSDTIATAAQANVFTAAQVTKLSDTGTNSALLVKTLGHNSSGVIAANFGVRQKFTLQDSTTADQDAAAIDAIWTTATHASHASALLFQLSTGGAALAEAARITPGGLVVPAGASGTPSLTFSGNTTYGMYFNSGSGVVLAHSGSDIFGTRTGLLAMPSGTRVAWTSGAITGTVDTGISRVSAGVMAVGNGGAADTTGTLQAQKIVTPGTITSGGSTTYSAQIGTSGPLIYSGSGAPTISAAVKGSLYLRTDGSSSSTRMYVATDTAGTWTAVTTAA